MIKKIYLSFLLVPMLFGSVQANILNIPGNFSTIQAAILAANNGDTLLVEPGTYFENINLRGKNILLTSRFYLAKDTSFICSTIINGSQPASADTGSCIVINSGEDSTCIVQGFTITGGLGTKWADEHGAGFYREGGGILIALSSPEIRNNYIIQNTVTNTVGVSSTGGGGMRCGDGHPFIHNNLIAYNKARYGCGVVFNFCQNPLITNNLIIHNSGGQSYGGGGLWLNGANNGTIVHVFNNTIAYNKVSGSFGTAGKGGAIMVQGITLDAKNNIIWGNTQVAGLAIRNSAGITNVSYCDMDFGFTGIGNLNLNPLFTDSLTLQISAASPCIDAGDTTVSFSDSSSSPTQAIYPSLGTNRNDMGAYGGKWAAIFSQCASLYLAISKTSSLNAIQIFPNPAKDFIQIKASNQTIKAIYIYASNGAQVYSSNYNQATIILENRSFLPVIYFIKIQLENEVLIRKIEFN